MPAEKKVPLEDLMVAMDVVDTLRHRDMLVDRELDADVRRERLVEKLREIYASQGIEVTDKMLNEGVRALEEDRFIFTPAPDSFSTFLAKLYVTRGKWMKPLVTLLTLFFLLSTLYYMIFVRPQQIEKENLPRQIENVYRDLIERSADTQATTTANILHQEAGDALKGDNTVLAKEKLKGLKALLQQLKQSYRVQIVQGPNRRSGIWRVPPGKSNAKNYYLIVEAVDAEDKKITVAIRNEENDEIAYVKSWGIRVDEETFHRIAQDKADDGIIQERVVGVKNSGYLNPLYTISTTGATITKW